ncbi:MAG: LON peptidase substrate-binding domain-containing protein [Kineosporiaceae bacterium]
MVRHVPLFPLGSVLFPGLVLPLHIFEPRYRALVRDLLAQDPEDRVFGVVAIRSGHEVGHGAARALYDTGCLARVQTVQELPDGRFDITTVGTSRFRLEEVDWPRTDRDRVPTGRPYLRAAIEALNESDGEASGLLARAVRAQFARYREALGVSAVKTQDLDARLLSYVVSSAMLLDLSDRQELLETEDATGRLRLALRLLRREAVMLRELGAVPGTDAARMPPGVN